MKHSVLHRVFYIWSVMLFIAIGSVNGQTWNRVAISDLTSTDVFVILDTTSSCAMINSNGASSAPTPYALTLNGDKSEIIGNVPENCKWSIEEDATGYIFHPNGTTSTWLYSTSSNNGIRVGSTNANKHFIMESDFLKNVEYGRFVGIYNEQDWRSYTSIHTNIASTRTCFYKYTAVQSDVPTPTISLASGTYYTAQTVTLACEDPDAVIRYTLDGTQPDETSPVYSEAITITQTTTLKAVAELNDELSAVATAHYTFPIDAADLATLRQGATNGTIYRYTGTAVVTFANASRNQKYIQDATAAILIDDDPGNITTPYAEGDAITGIIGTLNTYNSMLQFAPSFDPGDPVSSGNPVVSTVLSCDELLANAEIYEAQLVTLTNVIINPIAADTFAYNKYYNLNDNSNPKLGIKYNDLDLIGETIPTVAQNVTGVICDYNGTYEIFPRSMADLEDYEDTPITDPQTYYTAFVVAGHTDVFDTIFYTEGEAAIDLPTPLVCKNLQFIGWASEEWTSPVADLSGVELIEGAFTPTKDTTLYAVFSQGQEDATGIFNITRESFDETVSAYGTLDAWTATDLHEVDTLEGFCDLYPNNNTIQMNASRAGMYNTRPVPGIATGIGIRTASNSSNRTWTPYVADVPLSEENYLTEGTALEPKAIAGGDSEWWDISLSDTYRYFYLSFNTNAAYLEQVEIHYFKPEAITYLSFPEPDTTTIIDQVCEGQSYNDWGLSLDEPVTGIYFTELPSEAPYCSEIMRVELTVQQHDTLRIDTAACGMLVLQGDPDRTYTTSTIDTISEPNNEFFYGCPITTIYNITIHEPSSVTLNIDTCGSYTWGDETYNESGTHVRTYTDANGCDSTVTLNLTIRHGENHEETISACGNEYTWTYAGNVETLTASDTYTRTVAGEYCDDTYTLHLTLNTPDTTDLYAQICSGETYNQNGFNVTEAGDYQQTLTNAAGCDSLVRLHLTVGSATITELADVTCQNSHYTANGFDILAEEAGVIERTVTIERPGTCDSIVHLVLTVNPVYHMEVSDEACGEYTWHGETYNESGEYTWNGQTANGCDSTVVLALTIHQTATITIADEACSSYTWNNNTYTESGEYTWVGQTVNGCDSTVILQLTIYQPDATEFEATSVDTYAWNNEQFTESGDYTRIFSNIHGCDSTVTLHLTITHNYTVTFDVNGNTETVPAVVFNTADEALTLPTLEGCGNMSFIGWSTNNELGDNPTVVSTLVPTGDITLYAVFAQLPELDSIVITRASFATVAAYGTPDEWQTLSAVNGTAITGIADLFTNGTYMQMRGTAAPHPYNVTELPGNILSISIIGAGTGSPRPWTPYLANTPLTADNFSSEGTSLNTQTAADNSSEVRWDVTTPARYFYLSLGGNAVYVSSITITYTTGDLRYTLNPTEEIVLNESICNGQTYNDNIFNESEAGTYEATIPGEGFCATHYTLHLTVNQPVTNEITETACNEFEWQGETLTISGDYTATFTAANGCDSTVTLHLTINTPVTNEITETACNEFEWQGETLTTSGDYTATFTAANGCDSTVTLHLTINTPVTSEITESACNEFEWQGETLTTSGDYTATFTAANGCDSTVTLHLTINTPVTSEITETACNEFEWQGETLTTSGDYTATLTAANGCDSTVTLHLTINQPVTAADNINICESELPYTWNGVVFEDEGTESVTLTASNGCDSLLTMTLTVNRINTEVEWNGTAENFNFLSAVQDNAEYQWIDCSTNEPIEGATQQQFFPVVSGSYACIITYNGCTDTTYCEYAPVGIHEMCCGEIRCYPNPTTGMVNVQCTMNNVQWKNAEIQVLDMYGRLLHVETMYTSTMQIDLSSYANGIYLLRWVDEGSVMGTVKVLLNR